MLTPHCSAASGMVAPLSIAATTRLRKSSEYGFAIHAGLLPVASLNHIRASMGIPDSAFSGNALARHDHVTHDGFVIGDMRELPAAGQSQSPVNPTTSGPVIGSVRSPFHRPC